MPQTDGIEMAEFEVTATWRSTQTVEVPAESVADYREMVRAGEMPNIIAEQIDASMAELVDWSA